MPCEWSQVKKKIDIPADDGRTKPRSKKAPAGDDAPAENLCLIRAQRGSRKISTVVSCMLHFQLKLCPQKIEAWLAMSRTFLSDADSMNVAVTKSCPAHSEKSCQLIERELSSYVATSGQHWVIL